MADYWGIKDRLEEEGYRISNEEFSRLVEYTRRKARMEKKDESYLPLLLPDVVKEHFFRKAINAITLLRMGGKPVKNKG